MKELFHSSNYSIAHAKRRIRELEGEISIFLESDPYVHLVHTDTQRGKDVHKIKLTKPMPVAVPGIAFDALNNLRSALDQAGYATAIAAGRTGKSAHFPFGDTIVEAQSTCKRRSKQIPPKIFEYMMRFKPYRGGNDLLWALNKMCNANKHEVITPIIVQNTGVNFGETVDEVEVPGGMSATTVTSLRRSLWGNIFFMPLKRLNDEIEVFTVPSGQGSKYDLSLTFLVGVTKIDVVSGKAIDALLNDFAGIVERVISGVEAEARRIGLVK